MHYDFNNIEKKWQKIWEEQKLFKTQSDPTKKKYYVLDMFPYPSGDGLHVGHVEGYTATDIIARYKRMQGYNVLHPMGWDAFGLPAEQYALATGNDPREFTYKNISNFKRQIKELGKSIDWDREFATADSNYYKWTQWIFKKLYEHDLAELKEVEVNFCEELGTVLANDEIVITDGKMFSERGNYPVIKKPMMQWVLKITKYADRLLDDLSLVDYPPHLVEIQKNWIGRSKGAVIKFRVENLNETIECFTTRPDTIYGATYFVLAPEHPLTLKITNESEINIVNEYVKNAKQKQEIDRISNKNKTGVFTGSYAINPLTQQPIPIWIADYVLPHYGTGAVMAVPGHDERDFDFAQKYGLEIIDVVKSLNDNDSIDDFGISINSDFLNGLESSKAIEVILKYIEDNKIGYAHKTYKMHDWVFSRQRYWGEPFPVFYDKNKNIHLIKDEDLPVELPILNHIKPSGTGESPLVHAKDWLKVEQDGITGLRDTNTMPQLAGSSWYYLAYVLKNHLGLIPLNTDEARKVLDEFLPVDIYMGGAEHAVGHLLYSRFWHKFFYDIGLVSTKEPYLKLVNQGMILGPDNSKMSKSRGNVVSPDDVIKTHGADALRLYEMFLGPIEADKPWQTDGLDGSKRFLDRFVRLFNFEITNENQDSLNKIHHETIKKVTDDYNNLNFNTAIAQIMTYVNHIYKHKKIGKNQARDLVKLLNPVAPHITEELNSTILNFEESLIYSSWPVYNEELMKDDSYLLVVQINGRVRAKIEVSSNLSDDEVKLLAKNDDNVKTHLANSEIIKEIFIPRKIYNLVIKPE